MVNSDSEYSARSCRLVGTVVFTPLSGTQTMALDGSLTVHMAWTVATCGTGQMTTTFTVNGVQRQVSSHVSCATKPNP